MIFIIMYASFFFLLVCVYEQVCLTSCLLLLQHQPAHDHGTQGKKRTEPRWRSLRHASKKT